jgi:3-hydroxy-9,10-secoandrosta-1,3,5(10)-triene-9,17-dione monooxygenase
MVQPLATVSEDGRDYDDLLAAARALVPALHSRSAKAEALRRVPEESLDDLHRAGLFRMLQPRRVGGSELPIRAMVEICSVIGSGCGSTAWVLGNLASHHWMLALWDVRAQEEVWGETPDALVASAFVFPAGHAYRTQGGYRLSGRWKFSSGIDPSRWNMVGAIVHDPAIGEGEYRMFLLPQGDYQPIDTWFVAGLKGTGSKDVVVEDVFVPDYRTLSVAATKDGTAPGRAVNPGALYRIPCFDMFPYVVAGAALGIAEGAAASFVQEISSRVAAYSATRVADYAAVQIRLAEATAAIDAARLVLLRNCDEVMAIAEGGGLPTLEQKVRYRRDGAYAAKLCTRAVDQLFEAYGGDGLYDLRDIQRAFRDVHAASGHAALTWDVAATSYGKVALGIRLDHPTL